MQLEIILSPEQYYDTTQMYAAVARKMGCAPSDLSHVEVLHRSLDARRRPCFRTTLEVFRQGETLPSAPPMPHYVDCHSAPPVVIVGAGPAGLFAALHALELGLRPIIVERGFPVEKRRLHIAAMSRSGVVNPQSNWCFGEGGAGTYSDGKLYTRSTKRGNVRDVLLKLVQHGASHDILIDTHAHIGTDRLSGIMQNIRHTVMDHGGSYLFGQRVADLRLTADGRVCGVQTDNGDCIDGTAVILATGHSARDIYELFARRGWLLEAKPFALGVRVEHPQALINSIQYHSAHPSPLLPPANYSLTTQVEGHGVFSFCMCPGGVIVPASTDSGQQVVNGMSDSGRTSPFANSGIAVTVSPADVPQYADAGALALLRFQQEVEQRACQAGGDGLKAPAQRLTDFCQNVASQKLNRSNYLGSCTAAPLHECLPPFVTRCLQAGFRAFDRKMRGFLTSEASVLAVESRTSSPVRIPRGDDGQHPQLRGLYPCGEGAGYAGGIVSAALDGIRAIDLIAASR